MEMLVYWGGVIGKSVGILAIVAVFLKIAWSQWDELIVIARKVKQTYIAFTYARHGFTYTEEGKKKFRWKRQAQGYLTAKDFTDDDIQLAKYGAVGLCLSFGLTMAAVIIALAMLLGGLGDASVVVED